MLSSCWRLAWRWRLLVLFSGVCGVCFLARVCVTVQAWDRAVFCALRVSGLSLLFMRTPLHVVVVLLCVMVGASSVFGVS